MDSGKDGVSLSLTGLLADLRPERLIEVALRIDAQRDEASEALLVAHHGVAAPGQMTTPFQYQAGLVARERGTFAFNRLERAFLPPAPQWIHHDLSPEHFTTRLHVDRLVAGKLWPFQHDAPVADYELSTPPKWWSHGLVHALVGGASWPAMSELDVALVARLSEAVAAWHWYWLSELGREYCPQHTVASGDGTPDCPACRRLELDGRRVEVRDRRLRSEAAHAIAANAVQVLSYEAACFARGIAAQEIIEPSGAYLDLGEASDYALFHHRRAVSPAWQRYLEHCTRPGEVAASPDAFASRAADVVRALLTPRAPSPEVAARRARRVLQDVGWRLCHAAALGEEPTGGYAAGLRAVADGLGALRDDMTGADADQVLGAALEAVTADVTTGQGPSAAAVFALGYRPTASRDAEPGPIRDARRDAYLARMVASGSPLRPLIARVPGVVEQVLDGPRTPRLIEELVAAAEVPTATPGGVPVIEAALGWFTFAAQKWGPDDAAAAIGKRWWYRLACRTLPPKERWADYRLRPNLYLDGIPTPFDRAWLEDLVADRLPTDRTLAPRFTTGSVGYALVGQGRKHPLLLPMTGRRKRLLDRLQYTPTLAELAQAGFTEEALREAIDEELVLCVGQASPAALFALHPGRPWEAAGAAAPAEDRPLNAAPPTPAPEHAGPWEDPEQAAYYEAYCERSALYSDLASSLVEHTGVAAGQHVADLGSGTGVSARAALAVVGPQGSVSGLDPAPRMVAAAKRRVDDPRARFAVGNARDLVRFTPPTGSFDAVICSSAIWLDPDVPGALAATREALVDGGRLGMSIIAEYLGHSEHLSGPVGEAIAKAVLAAREALGLTSGAPDAAAPPAALGDMVQLEHHLREAGFSEVEATLYRRPWSLGEYVDWLTQPVVLNGMTPGLGPEGRAAFVTHLAEALDLDTPHESRWFLVRAVR